MATRQAALSAEARAAVLDASVSAPSPVVRASAIWAHWGANVPGGVARLTAALKDANAVVRVAAAETLLSMGKPAGLSVIIEALSNKDSDAFRLAQTTFNLKVLVDGKARYPLGKAEVRALGNLLRSHHVPGAERITGPWYLRKTAIQLLGQSGRPEAIAPLIETMRYDRGLRGGKRNMCRCIVALGRLRARAAVPDLAAFVARGDVKKTNANFGDTAETDAADALAAIADPASVPLLIDVLDSDKPRSAPLALSALTRMFSEETPPADRALLPGNGRLEFVRIDELPPREKVKQAWKVFWSTNKKAFAFDPDSPVLKRR
jgi:HEAT repeat protein